MGGSSDEVALTGKALIDQKREELRDRVARRVERETLWGVEDMPAVGSTVLHIATEVLYTVAGHKHEGGERGYSLKIQELGGTRVRHVRPWAVEVVDSDEFDNESDEVEA